VGGLRKAGAGCCQDTANAFAMMGVCAMGSLGNAVQDEQGNSRKQDE